MPNYQRVLVRYRQAEPKIWSDLHWCDIEQNPENGNIQVKVARAQGSAMPVDRAFVAVTPEEARKLLVWDVTATPARAYGLVLRGQDMYQFLFNRSLTNLFVTQGGQYWSFVNNDCDNEKPRLGLQRAFSADEIKADDRLKMRTNDDYNYNLLTEVAANLPVLAEQYTAWKEQKKIIAEQEKQARIAAEELEKQRQAELERKRIEAAAAEKQRKEAEERRHEQSVNRPPDRKKTEVLMSAPPQDIEEDALLALQMQLAETGDDNYLGSFIQPTSQPPINRSHPSNENDVEAYKRLCELGKKARRQRQGTASNRNTVGQDGFDPMDMDAVRQYEEACRKGKEAQARRHNETSNRGSQPAPKKTQTGQPPQTTNETTRDNVSALPTTQPSRVAPPPSTLGQNRFFLPSPAAPRPSRRAPAQLQDLILTLVGAALCAYGLYMATTAPWMALTLIAIGALCVCASILRRYSPPQNGVDNNSGLRMGYR